MSVTAKSRWVLLVLGAVFIIAAAIYTAGHMTDRAAVTVLLPGFIIGLILIGIYIATGKRDRDTSR